VPRVVPAGEAVNRVEAPRGELFYYVKSNGTAYPERVKVRTPTFANIPAFLKTAEGGSIADVPANFVSLDPCFSCTDR
jgi:Ni,Fe-hydrogenase III large subunit